jgi:hypothetical protein
VVHLSELLKQPSLLLGWDSDAGIGDGEAQCRMVVDAGDPNRTVPLSVNLMALPTRFSRTWRNRPASPLSARGTSGASRLFRAMCFSCARGPRRVTTLSTTPPRSKSPGCNSSLPASIFEKSRMSFRMVRSASPDSRMVSA